MSFPRVRFSRRWSTAGAALLGLSLAVMLAPGTAGRAQEVSEKDVRKSVERITGPSRPMSAQVARTWIALHEARLRPLPDRTPLRQVLQALRDATRGKAGWAEGVDFRVVSEALLEAEITIDAPVALPFVGRPEVPVDMYLKYLLHQFVWERYVGEGAVVIDSPCDDCLGYETVSAAEAHTWLLLHETAALEVPQRARLGDFLSAIASVTSAQGQDGRSLLIYAEPSALSAKGISLNTPVPVDAERAELGDRLRTALKPLGLDLRVLTDGTVMLTELDDGQAGETVRDAFPEYRFSYLCMYNQWLEALEAAAQARSQLEQARKATRP